MGYLKELNYEIETNPGYTMLMSVMAGILFSEISFGLVYVILFLILWEFLYFAYLHANYRHWKMIDRVLILLGAVLGFLLGRFLHEDDNHDADLDKFVNDYHHYGKEFGWF